MTTARPRLNLQAMSQLAALSDYAIPFAIRAVCRLGVADHLARGPLAIGELASACNAHAPALLRVLRALVTREIFSEPAEGTFGLTAMGELLKTDHPLSMRWAFRLGPDVSALSCLEQCVRSGEPATQRLFGVDYFAHLQKHPDLIQEFHDSQKAHGRIEELSIMRAYEWGRLELVVDIGGGDGSFLAHLLQNHPGMHGIVLDLPHMLAAAREVLALADVAGRCELMPADFRVAAMPAAADAYVLKRVLASQDDREATALLRSIRKAAGKRSRLLVLEPTLPDAFGYAMDILMLAVGRGHVRTQEDFEALLEAADFKLVRVVTKQLLPFFEAVPV